MTINIEEALEEHLFWLQMMDDSTRFILDALPVNETEIIKKAREFIT